MHQLSTIDGKLQITGSRYSADTCEREREGFRQSEAVTWEQLEAMDFVDFCVHVGIKPSRFRDMLAGIDLHDEMAVDAAIRTGIHRLVPSLDDYAYIVIRHLYRPLETFAEAAE